MNKGFYLLLFVLFFTMSCSKTKLFQDENGLIIELPAEKKGQAARKIQLRVLSPEIIKVAVSDNDSVLNSPDL